MTQVLRIHPQTPQPRLVRTAAEALAAGGLIVYPTDSYYAFGCAIDSTRAVRRIRELRGFDETNLFTLSCADLTQIGDYGVIDNAAFRVIRARTPGPVTFVLKATKQARRLHHPKRHTVAFRAPAHPVARALLAEIGAPIITSTLRLRGDSSPLKDTFEIRERLEKQIDVFIDSGPCPAAPTEVLDFSDGESAAAQIRPGGTPTD